MAPSGASRLPRCRPATHPAPPGAARRSAAWAPGPAGAAAAASADPAPRRGTPPPNHLGEHHGEAMDMDDGVKLEISKYGFFEKG